MLRKIYRELVAIRKELQVIKSNLEPEQKATDNVQKELENHMSLVNRMIENAITNTRDR